MHRIFFGVKRVWYKLRRNVEDMLDYCYFGVTPAQYDVLRILWAHEHGLARFVLVRLLGVSGPVVSRMLRALENQGLIVREKDTRDRRLVIVSLSEAGRDSMLENLEDIETCAEADAENAFSADRDSRKEQMELFERYLWRARYVNDETTPFLDPFIAKETRDFWGNWIRLNPPPPLKFAA